MTWPEWVTRYGALGRSLRELGDTVDAAVSARDREALEAMPERVLWLSVEIGDAAAAVPEADYADDGYRGPRGRDVADDIRHAQVQAQRLKR